MIHSAKIQRAERFGTQHLLPSTIQKAEFAAKKAERMKRFQTADAVEGAVGDGAAADGAASKKQIASDRTKLMERKLRFGTMTAAESAKGKKDKFGDKTLDEIAAEKKGTRKKGKVQQRTSGKGRRGGKGRGRGGRGGKGARGGRSGRGRARVGGNQQYRLVDGQFTAQDQQRMSDRRMRFEQY